MVTRKIKPTVVETPVADTPQAAAPQDATLEDMVSAFRNALENAPSAKRVIIATVMSIVSSFCAGYFVGYVANYLIVGAMVLTGSVFIGMVIQFLAILLAMYAGYIVGDYVWGAVISKKAEAACSTAKDYAVGSFNQVRGWFATKPVAA